MTVTDLAGRPIEGALVRATDGDPFVTSIRDRPPRLLLGAAEPVVVEARTDAAGCAELPPVASPFVAVSAPGRATATEEVGREIDERTVGEASFRLGPGYTLSGRVLDEEGRPVGGCAVGAFGSGAFCFARGTASPPVATSDPEGRFVLRGVSAGTNDLGVRAPGRIWAPAVRVSIPGVRELDVTLPPVGAIEGVITDRATGAPLAGARVWTTSQNRPETGVVTDGAGRYRIDGVPAGPYWGVRAERPGYVPGRERPTDNPDPNRVLTSGTLRQDVALDRGAAVEGTVTCDGAPVADAEVEVAVRTAGFDDPQSVCAVTGADGSWRVAGIGAGPAVVIVRAAGFVQPDAPEPWSATSDRCTNPPAVPWPCVQRHGFRVPATGTVRRDVVVERAAESRAAPASVRSRRTKRVRITGRVLGPDGLPPRDAVVCVRVRTPHDRHQCWDPLQSSRRGPDPIGLDGAFDVSELVSMRPGWRTVICAISFDGGYAESALHLGPLGAEEFHVDLRVGRPVHGVGRVTRDGRPVAGAHVRVAGPRRRRRIVSGDRAPLFLPVAAVSGPDGRFAAPVGRPGRCTVHVQASDFGEALLRDVEAPGPEVAFDLPRMSEISGRLVRTDDTPCAGALVSIVTPDRTGEYEGSDGLWGGNDGPGWTLTREDGAFRVRGVPVDVPVWLRIGRPWDSGLNVPTGGLGPVPPGRMADPIGVPPGRSLTGRIVDRSGRPVGRVTVVAWPVADEDRESSQHTVTGDDGTFVVNALWPPPWHVSTRLDVFPYTCIDDPGTFTDDGPVEVVVDPPQA